MPKRVLDGEAIWGSQRISRLPDWMRVHYAWLYPLALANGVFECNARQVWGRCYAVNMPHLSVEDVASILNGMESQGLLFRWDEGGKTWGYWTNSDKPGRLPGISRRGKNESVGPEPPLEKLKQFMDANGIQMFPGFGSGLGLGIGSGSEGAAQQTPLPLPLAFQGQALKVTHAQDRALGEAFPWADRPTEYRIADSWLVGHPRNRPKDFRGFMHNWFRRIPAPQEQQQKQFKNPTAMVGAAPELPASGVIAERLKKQFDEYRTAGGPLKWDQWNDQRIREKNRAKECA